MPVQELIPPSSRIKGTELENMYNRGEVPLISMNEYVSTVCDFMERLRPDIIIQPPVRRPQRRSLSHHAGVSIRALYLRLLRTNSEKGDLPGVSQ
jgi:histone acetyltransferase (RNA polymerase elongator complex component)